QFRRVFANSVGIGNAPARIDTDVVAVEPAQLREPLHECCHASLILGIVCGAGHQHTDAPHPLALLRACRERPCCRAAEHTDELARLHCRVPPVLLTERITPLGRGGDCCAAVFRPASFYSITLSARASRAGGIVRPSASAVLRLMTSSNFIGACTGRSAGF